MSERASASLSFKISNIEYKTLKASFFIKNNMSEDKLDALVYKQLRYNKFYKKSPELIYSLDIGKREYREHFLEGIGGDIVSYANVYLNDDCHIQIRTINEETILVPGRDTLDVFLKKQLDEDELESLAKILADKLLKKRNIEIAVRTELLANPRHS